MHLHLKRIVTAASLLKHLLDQEAQPAVRGLTEHAKNLDLITTHSCKCHDVGLTHVHLFPFGSRSICLFSLHYHAAIHPPMLCCSGKVIADVIQRLAAVPKLLPAQLTCTALLQYLFLLLQAIQASLSASVEMQRASSSNSPSSCLSNQETALELLSQAVARARAGPSGRPGVCLP